MKIFKKISILMLCAVMLLCSLPISVFAAIESTTSTQETEENEKTIEVGDYITLGSYYGESIVWRCVSIDENGPLMLSDKILCLKALDACGEDSYYHTDGWGRIRVAGGSNCWSDSNLRQWLNSSDAAIEWSHCPPTSERVYNGYNAYATEAGFLSGFSSSELSMIKTVTQKNYLNDWETSREGYCDGGTYELIYSVSSTPKNYDTYYYQNVTDKIFLLNPEQADAIYQNLGTYLYNAYPTQSAVDNSDYKDANLSIDKTWAYLTAIPRNEGASYECQTIFQSSGASVTGAFYGTMGVRPAFYLDTDTYVDSDESDDTTKKVVIHGREFDENIDYFTTFENSSNYNPVLSNMLAALSAAAYNETDIENAYKALGFVDYSGTKDYNTSDPYRCGYNISLKDSNYNNEKICLITVRGSATEFDWLGNASLATTFDDKHMGFAYPANYIYLDIETLISTKQVSLSDVKFVITGHSRGAAVANLLSVDLMEKGVSPNSIYNYNYACPDVACKKIFPSYSNIFNLCNRPDPVPLLPGPLCSTLTTPGTSWGKYGNTLYFTQTTTKIGKCPSHDMDTYLKFLDQKLNTYDWGYDITDAYWDGSRFLAGFITKILCPVDVIITDKNGNIVASVIGGETNYYNSEFGEIIIFTDGDKKIIYINGNNDFNVNLVGTDDGTMTFALERCNLTTGEISQSKTFNDVVLEDGKTMYCSVDEATEINNVSLFVVEEKDGEMIYTHTIETDGTETVIPCEHTWNDGDITKQPTHTVFGEQKYTCNDCGATRTEQIEKTLNHTFSTWVYVSNSEHVRVCDCSELETQNHSFGEWIITKEATDSEDGIQERTCACGHTESKKIPPISDSGTTDSDTSDSVQDDKIADHASCESDIWTSIWQAIINFFRRLFGLPIKCVCGDLLE